MMHPMILRRRRISGSGADAYAIGGASPELVAAFTLASDGTTAGEYFRKASSATTFDGLFTHSVSGPLTMFDSTGTLVWAPHNILLRSSEFDASPWQLTGQGAGVAPTLTPDYALAPDGTMTAYRLQCSRGSAGAWDRSRVEQAVASYGPIGSQMTNGIWVKSTDGSSQDIQVSDSTENNSISTVTVGAEWQLVGKEYDILLSAGGNIWVGLLGSATTALTADVLIWGAHLYRSDLGGMADNPDQTVSGLEKYVPTTSAAVYLPRRNAYYYNGSSWVKGGLRFESAAATNLLTHSEDFTDASWLKGANTATLTLDATGPDNVANSAVTLVDNSAGGTGADVEIQQTVTVSTATTYTASIFAKASGASRLGFYTQAFTTPASNFGVIFDLSAGTVIATDIGFSADIENCGDGWYRCSATFTTDAVDTSGRIYWTVLETTATSGPGSSNTVDLDGTSSVLIYGAQFEVGSVPSSYIPTTGSTVTRAAETLTIPSAKLPWPTPNVIGPELVTNGTFDTDTDWTKGTGWSISGGAANAVAGDSSGLSQSIGQQAGKVYQITFTVSNRTAGFVFLSGPFTGTSRSTNGTFTQVIVAANGVGDLAITKDTSFDGTIDNISVREIDPLAVSIQMQGLMTYADDGAAAQETFLRWYADANNYITLDLDTDSTATGEVNANQSTAGTLDTVVAGAEYSAGVNVAFNIASRHTSGAVNVAKDGTAATADTTPTALADLSSVALTPGYDFNGFISELRVWGADIGDSGIAEVTAA